MKEIIEIIKCDMCGKILDQNKNGKTISEMPHIFFEGHIGIFDPLSDTKIKRLNNKTKNLRNLMESSSFPKKIYNKFCEISCDKSFKKKLEEIKLILKPELHRHNGKMLFNRRINILGYFSRVPLYNGNT